MWAGSLCTRGPVALHPSLCGAPPASPSIPSPHNSPQVARRRKGIWAELLSVELAEGLELEEAGLEHARSGDVRPKAPLAPAEPSPAPSRHSLHGAAQGGSRAAHKKHSSRGAGTAAASGAAEQQQQQQQEQATRVIRWVADLPGCAGRSGTLGSSGRQLPGGSKQQEERRPAEPSLHEEASMCCLDYSEKASGKEARGSCGAGAGTGSHVEAEESKEDKEAEEEADDEEGVEEVEAYQLVRKHSEPRGVHTYSHAASLTRFKVQVRKQGVQQADAARPQPTTALLNH